MKICITRELFNKIVHTTFCRHFDGQTKIETESTCLATCCEKGYWFELWYTIETGSVHGLHPVVTPDDLHPDICIALTLYADSNNAIKELRRRAHRTYDHCYCTDFVERTFGFPSKREVKLTLFSESYSWREIDDVWTDEESGELCFSGNEYLCNGCDGLYDRDCLERFFTIVDDQESIPNHITGDYIFLGSAINLNNK